MLCLLWSYFFTMFVIILGWNNIHVYLTGKQIPIYLLFCFVVGLNKCLVWGHQRRHLNSPTKPPSECLYHYIIDCTVPIHGQYVVYMYDCTYTQPVCSVQKNVHVWLPNMNLHIVYRIEFILSSCLLTNSFSRWLMSVMRTSSYIN